MGPPDRGGLNDPGEDDAACVVTRGATHTSRSQRTTSHAHYAWKVHVGLDGPVWVESEDLTVRPADGARVIVVPPNVEHATGAVGWSVALFVEPGSRGTPSCQQGATHVIDGALARATVDACRPFATGARSTVADLVDEIAALTLARPARRIDPRVLAALDTLRRDPGTELARIAASVGLSRDRMTHMVSEATGMPPRRHALWARLLRVLSTPTTPANLASVAALAGFSDHAHMTRTFRRFLGRVPSDFERPPVVLAPWHTALDRAPVGAR